jgi:hypothetical protein
MVVVTPRGLGSTPHLQLRRLQRTTVTLSAGGNMVTKTLSYSYAA